MVTVVAEVGLLTWVSSNTEGDFLFVGVCLSGRGTQLLLVALEVVQLLCCNAFAASLSLQRYFFWCMVWCFASSPAALAFLCCCRLIFFLFYCCRVWSMIMRCCSVSCMACQCLTCSFISAVSGSSTCWGRGDHLRSREGGRCCRCCQRGQMTCWGCVSGGWTVRGVPDRVLAKNNVCH